MKILILANKFPYPPKDGGVIAKLALIKGFYAHDCDITVVAINTSKHYTDVDSIPGDIKKLADFRDTFVDTKITAFCAIKNLLFSKLPYSAERFLNKDFEKNVKKTLQEKKFDIIQLEGLYVCPYIPLIRKYSDALIAYRAHNIEYEIWERSAKETKTFLRKWYLTNLAKRVKKMEVGMLNQYDLLVPISQKDCDGLIKDGNKKPFHVCQTGIVGQDYLIAQSQSSQLSLFHLGGLDWPPNQQGILWFLEECWDAILKKVPELVFRVGGRNAPEWFLQRLSKFTNVEFCGEVDSASQFFADNSIMIVPLLAGSGMRIKIIEGMALQKAIVSTSVGAEGISAESGKDICIADASEDFSNEIIQLIKNPERIRIIGENALTFVRKNYDNSKITADLLSFYGNNIADN